MTTEIERLPPQDLDAERAVLGSLLIDSDAVSAISGKIQSDDFYREQHRAIFDAVSNIAERNERSDAVTVSDELRRSDSLDLAGGPPYIADLINAVPTAFHVEHYADIVRRSGILRRVIQAAGQMVAEAYRAGADPDAVLDHAESLIFGIANEMRTSDFEPLRTILHEFNDQLMFRMQHRGVLSGVSTGISHLDRLTGGLQRSDLIVLAARPGMGKTSFALQLAMHAWEDDKEIPVGFFALEMPGHQLAQRIVSHRSRVDSMRIRDGNLNDDELGRTVAAMTNLGDYSILIDDSPSLSVLELRGKARRMQLEHNIGLLIIDYLQLMSSAVYRDNRVQEITEITRSLKSLARELNIPVVACAQLSRAVEQRPNPTPRLSDLRESGSIEQDADVVIFLHEHEREDEVIGKPADLRLTIAKQRNGPVGELDLRFVRSHGRFEEAPEQSL